MMDVTEVHDWLAEIRAQGTTQVAIDDGGLSLIGFDEDGKRTGQYIEVGGEPVVEL